MTVRDHVLVEDDCAPTLAAAIRVPHKTRTLVTPEFRFTRTSTNEELLFDMAADPDETLNLAQRDPALRSDAVEGMMTALIAADDLARGAPASSG